MNPGIRQSHHRQYPCARPRVSLSTNRKSHLAGYGIEGAILNKFSSSFDRCKLSRNLPKASGAKVTGLRRCIIATLLVAVTLFSTSALSQTEDGGEAATPHTYPYIFIGNADGSSVKPLFRGLNPRWSPPAHSHPHGAQIIFYTPGEGFRQGQMHVIDANRSGGHWVGPGIEPSWAPDGKHFAYVNNEGIALWDLVSWY